MFTNYLKKENIRFVQNVSDWKEAVHLAVEPLIEGGYVSPKYINGIIENTEYYGAYYVITDHVALLHARPEQGVIDTQFSITLLDKDIYFLDNKRPARLLITLATKNSSDHLEALQAFARLLENEESIRKLIEQKNVDEFYEFLLDATKAM
ncbi:MAG: PTS sugar transporter subunit IIA [Anaerorhabdus sp.]|uniref:PTS sugar transporter subunit IIA n=1 Tax=Anaerorhabdus sp. TaxID=1872524 RepID=UPI003A8A59D8